MVFYTRMANGKIHNKLSVYRYEVLLAALFVLIFDKIFFQDNTIYLQYIWPLNMLLIAIACYGIFNERKGKILWLRNIFSLIAVAMPFLFIVFSANYTFLWVLTIFFSLYYTFIFVEVMKQIISSGEIRLNVVIGSFCGYLLLSMIALFAYLSLELNHVNSFHGLSGDVALKYNELSYFSFITLTSIGFGDIYPITDTSRLVTAFFGMMGQFYMVAVVGIIISKFSNKN